jgi:rhamnose transport system permease protein
MTDVPEIKPPQLNPSSAVIRSREPAPMWRKTALWLYGLLRFPETMTVLLLAAAFAVGAMLNSHFLDPGFLLDSTSLYMEVGVMALTMTLVIISGNIDLSVASNLALTAVTCAKLHADAHVPMPLLIFLAPVLGGLLGLFNGVMIIALGLPSLTVTLGTLALYRGLAQVMAGDHSIGKFPDWFVGIDYRTVGIVPLPLIIFLVLAAITGLVLKKTVFGRCVYALGTNEAAARFSGLRVNRVKLTVFVLSGVASGIGSMMMLSRLSVARWDLSLGDELAVITAVVLGGTDIFGGRGSILGTVIALFLLGIIRQGMGLANIAADNQLAVTGSLLVASVLLARLSARVEQRTNLLKRAATELSSA